MFWRFGGYANISTIDSILDKPDVTLEEVLDETDLIQELKQHNSKLIDYLRDEDVLRRLFEYVIAPPIDVPDEDVDQDEDEPEPARRTFVGMRSLSLNRTKDTRTKRQEEREEQDKQEKNRQKYAFAACEILSSETWSIMEAMLECKDSLRNFWSFLERDAPLDPVTASYFSKIVEPLLDKKTGEMLDFVRSYGSFVPMVLKHIDTPNIMDVLLKMISVERSEGGAGVIEWLHDQDLMPSLLSYVGSSHPTSTQIAAGDFIKAIVTISANASQNEQQCIGPNSLTRQLVSDVCVRSLISDMLEGGNPLTVGVGIVIEVIRKNNSDYDPDVGGGPEASPSSSDPIYLGTLLRLFADNVPHFTALLTNPRYTLETHEATSGKHGRALKAAFGKTIEPLGFDRFKTCELMAELLHCSNMGLLNERGSEAFVRQKDQERERLRVEGTLSRSRSGTSSAEEQTNLAGRNSSEFGDEKIDLGRKLEVTNSADEDGFEELGTSAELEGSHDEKAKPGFEDGHSSQVQRIRPSESRLSLDDEFFDEPLTSPKIEPKSGGDLPAEPEKANLEDIQKPAKSKDEPEVSELADKSTSEQLVDAIESHLGPGSLATEAPPLPTRQDTLGTSHLTEGSAVRDLSPHPEDKPAPLFVKKVQTPQETKVTPEEAQVSSEKLETPHEPTTSHPPQTATPADTADDGATTNTKEEQVEQDVDGHPLVGDHLKMMFVEHKVIPTILDFFFRFPWNNFLHNVVYDVVQQVFNGPMDRGYNRFLAIDLFDTGRITDRIIEGQLRSDEAQAHSSMRLGYMGHLTLIAEEVVKFSERHPPEMLSDLVIEKISSKIWTDYVDNTLAETRERDNAILGGVRPDAVGGPRQAVLNAVNSGNGFNSGSGGLAGAGLAGGSDLGENGAAAGFVGGGSLLSGFGSSSDEEDDDMEEIGEHEEGASRHEQQYAAYTPTSLSALSIFSPNKDGATGSDAAEGEDGRSGDGLGLPPPLNIPPSRARRQLAARLARHNSGAVEIENTAPTSSNDAGTSLSAAFSSLNLPVSEGDDSDPWANIDKDRTEVDPHDEGLDWVDSAAHRDSKRQSADWVDFGEAGRGDSDEEEGEDIPIRLSLEPGPDRGRIVQRNYTDDRSGSGSSGSEQSSDLDSDNNNNSNNDDTAPEGSKVKEVSVRSAID